MSKPHTPSTGGKPQRCAVNTLLVEIISQSAYPLRLEQISDLLQHAGHDIDEKTLRYKLSYLTCDGQIAKTGRRTGPDPMRAWTGVEDDTRSLQKTRCRSTVLLTKATPPCINTMTREIYLPPPSRVDRPGAMDACRIASRGIRC